MTDSSRSSSIFRPDSSLPHDSPDSSKLPILRLCRFFSFLAAGAALTLLICAFLNARLWGEIPAVHPELLHKGLGLSNNHVLSQTSFFLNWAGLLMLGAAGFYGFKIVRQARADARKNEQFLLDAKQRTLELAALYDTTQQVSGTHELTALLQTILEKATTLLAAAGAAIFLYDHEHNDFQIAVEMGVGMPIGTHLSLNEGISGRVFQTRAPVIVNDYPNWHGRSKDLKALPIRATICVPMIRGGELVGILGVHEVTGSDRLFNDAEARLLSLFADNAAGAVHHAQLLDKLRSSEERFRIAAESASDLIYDWDLLADRAHFFGSRYEALLAENQKLAYTHQEFWDTLHPEDRERVQSAFRNHLEDGKPFSEEYRVSDGKGSYLNVVDKGMAIRNKHGKPVRFIGSVSDITERKRTEQMKSDFVSFVTHQLRTPLSGVKWMLELAMDAKDNPEEMQSFVQDARISTDRLIRLVNDLLDVSRLERGRLKVAPQLVDLVDLTQGVIAEMAPFLQEKQQVCSLQAPEKLSRPYVDAQLLRQVMLNLLSNSVKYSPVKGDIKICINPEASLVRWEIKDAGIGIPKADLGKLFEKFYRAGNVLAVETEGTGLGLYLVRLIVERFGGNVWCESEEGIGSTFVFTLPLAAKEVQV
jgi:signal transduction histidine kinase